MPDKRLTRSQADRPGAGILHLGLGAFYRAFGAIYVAEAMQTAGGDWGIIGVSLKSPFTRNALAPQNWAYTAVSLAPSGPERQCVEVIEKVLVGPENPRKVLDCMADPAVKIVTLTITEKGYCYIPATGALDTAHADIQHDLTSDLPRSAIGFLVRALQMRRAAGLEPFTVLSCDNLPNNGAVARRTVLDLAQSIDPDLADWIAREGAFPSSMVDRITPATTQADIDDLARATGVFDAAPVMHEPFRQWVIEDNFVNNARPKFEAVGADMVDDVTPFEHMKLRMLNGTHSALAYLGYLSGFETISDTVADPAFAAYLKNLWADEIEPSVAAPSGVNLAAYACSLLERYANPAVHHKTWQIAMDGSQKLPQRLLETLAQNIAAGRPIDHLCLAVAGWMRYVRGVDDAGRDIDVKDPLARALRDVRRFTATDDAYVEGLLSMEEIFPPGLATALSKPIAKAYGEIAKSGAHAAVRKLAAQ